MFIENEKLKIEVDIFNKKKFEISYREYNEEVVHNKQTFIYDIGFFIVNKKNKNLNKIHIVVTQECEETQYQPIKFSRIFDNEEETLKIFNREIEVARNGFNSLLLLKQTIECIEVNYENFEYYSQCVNINPNQNIYLMNYINEIIEREIHMNETIERNLNR